MLPLIVYILRDLGHHRGRTILTVIGLAGVSFSYLILAAVSETTFVFGDQETPSHNLVIIRSDVLFPTDGSLEDAVFEAINDLPPELVQRVSPMIYRQMKVNDLLVQLRAAPPADWKDVHGLKLIEGRWPRAEGEVAVSEGAINSSGWRLGELLHIFGAEFQVSAIFRASGTKFASVWMGVDQARRLFGDNIGYQLAFVRIRGGIGAEDTRSRLESDPRLAGRYAVYHEDRLDGRYFDLVDDMRNVSVFLTGIALLGITLGTYNSANLSLIERRRELGILRAVGFAHGIGRNFLMLRVAMQSLVAYALGTLAAVGFVSALQARGIVVVCAVCRPVTLTLHSVVIGLLLVLALAPLGAWLSARKSGKLSVARILDRPEDLGRA